jgi:hypothetical protein
MHGDSWRYDVGMSVCGYRSMHGDRRLHFKSQNQIKTPSLTVRGLVEILDTILVCVVVGSGSTELVRQSMTFGGEESIHKIVEIDY